MKYRKLNSKTKDKIRDVIEKIKEQYPNLVGSVVEGLLEKIPVVGGVLAKIYAKSADSDVTNTQVIQFLESLQEFDEKQFENLTNVIQSNQKTLLQNKDSLAILSRIAMSISGKLNEIHDLLGVLECKQAIGFNKARQDIRRVEDYLENLMKQDASSTTFDVNIKSEKLLFYLKLKNFLDECYNLFKLQLNLYEELKEDFSGEEIAGAAGEKIGKDHVASGLYSKLSHEQRKKFALIREVTENNKKYNMYAKDLLINNKEFFNDLHYLKDLFEHLSVWQAKYELTKNDENMCIIFTIDQEKEFPRELNNAVLKKIADLRKATLLD